MRLISARVAYGLGNQVAECLLRIIGASPSLTGVSDRIAECLIAPTIDFDCLSPSSPPQDRTEVDNAAISGAWGNVRGGKESASPKATEGLSLPKERIHSPTAAKETRTSQDPPS